MCGPNPTALAPSYLDLEAQLAAAEAEVRDLRGAMDADDERLRAASERVFGDFAFGCDTAMWLADEVMGLRQMLDVERAVREKAEARCAELEAALLTGIEWLLDMAERTNHLVTPGSCLAQAERLRALAGGGK